MKEQLEVLRKEFNERIDALVKDGLATNLVTLEKGKWYYGDSESGAESWPFIARYTGINQAGELSGDFISLRGLSGYSAWGSTRACDSKHIKRPATKEEIESALVAEAKKKYKAGNVIRTVDGNLICLSEAKFKYSPKYDAIYVAVTDDLWDFVYQRGKWAILERPARIEIGGYNAEYSGDQVAFGCKRFTQSDIISLLSCMGRNSIERIHVSGHVVTKTQIQQILNGFQ